jgi:Putative Actinobacterial Holin-X, holin superfamily III
MAIEIGRGSAAAKGEPPVGDLVREALGDTRELVRLEIALAREDVRGEIAAARTSAVAIVLAFAVAVMAVTTFVVAIVLALRVGWPGALVAGGILLLVAIALGLVGWKALPTRPLGGTRGRILSDVHHIKERIA